MMKASSNNLRNLLIVSAIFVQILFSGFNSIPVTGVKVGQFDILNDPVEYNPDFNGAPVKASGENKPAALLEFVESVKDGDSDTVRGIYAEDIFEYPVVQQPASQPGFVSEKQGVVTEFAMASKYGVTGILAHNFLAGSDFFKLETGNVIQVVYGDGSTQAYEITEVHEYQAHSPNSASSSFTDLETGETLTATQLFKQVYMGDHHLTLQTCIEVGAEDSWGRLFIIAEPLA